MNIIKSIIIAFSLYSRIPMPHFKWEDSDMDMAIAFLPLVGGVIGGVSFGILRLGIYLELPTIAVIIMLLLTPLILTGGFHVDGFMDVQDAGNSFQGQERRLEIMKDPHIGAFAVISLVVCGLFWLLGMDLLLENGALIGIETPFYIYCLSFPLVRAFCSLSCEEFEKAKKDGMLNRETGGDSKKKAVKRAVIYLEILICIALGMYFDIVLMGIGTIVLLAFMLYYKLLTKKLFGGVTGDTAGFFVVLGEIVMLVTLGVYGLFF